MTRFYIVKGFFIYKLKTASWTSIPITPIGPVNNYRQQNSFGFHTAPNPTLEYKKQLSP